MGFRLAEKNYGHLFVSSRKKSVLNIIQGDSFDSSSGNRLLRAYFETSEGLKGIYVTLRLGANYFLVRNTLKWDLE